jgi:dTDP-4-dehydrorhamnose 3,5-epimerase
MTTYQIHSKYLMGLRMSDFKAHEEIQGIWSRTTTRHLDERGFFSELFRLNKIEFNPVNFKQQNLSYSEKLVRRGMHVQENQWQLVTLLSGTVIDILLDVRIDSSTFGKFARFDLGCEPNEVNQLLVSPGIAHGFGVLSDDAYMLYASDRYYGETQETGIACQTPEIENAWPKNEWIESPRDRSFPQLHDAKNKGTLNSFTKKS